MWWKGSDYFIEWKSLWKKAWAVQSGTLRWISIGVLRARRSTRRRIRRGISVNWPSVLFFIIIFQLFVVLYARAHVCIYMCVYVCQLPVIFALVFPSFFFLRNWFGSPVTKLLRFDSARATVIGELLVFVRYDIYWAWSYRSIYIGSRAARLSFVLVFRCNAVFPRVQMNLISCSMTSCQACEDFKWNLVNIIRSNSNESFNILLMTK